jgi:MYXO-CTERM domain-containing protein
LTPGRAEPRANVAFPEPGAAGLAIASPGGMREINARVVGCLFATFTSLLGCGGVQSKTGVPIETAPDEIATTVCPKAYECCTAAQLMGNKDLAGTSEPDCEVKTKNGYANDISGIQASEMAGRSMYNGDKLAACLATIRASTCAMLNTTNHLTGVPGCDSFVTPMVQVGGACGNDYECVQGWCKPNQMMSGADGTCTVPTNGEPCTSDGRCAPRFQCDSSTNTCLALGAVADACTSDTQCQSGVCGAAAGATTTTCQPPADTCFYASGCAFGGPPPPAVLGIILLVGLGALARRRR